jgi:hypothetical protein
MVRTLIIAIVVLALIGAGVAYCSAQRQPAQAATATTSVTGEVVDLACYLAHNLTGPNHAACAVSCATGGAPLGILDRQSGKAYLIVLDHDKLMGAKTNQILAMFKPYIAKNVTAKGKVVQRSGLTGFVVTSVAAAK